MISLRPAQAALSLPLRPRRVNAETVPVGDFGLIKDCMRPGGPWLPVLPSHGCGGSGGAAAGLAGASSLLTSSLVPTICFSIKS